MAGASNNSVIHERSKEIPSSQNEHNDESQPHTPNQTSTTTSPPTLIEPLEVELSDNDDEEDNLQDNSRVPKMSLPNLFWFFFSNFGCFAWGGSVTQIAMLKDRLVIQDKWITITRFQRVFSVYQILPGPEAAELCMFFGCLSAGRLGGVVAGLGFMLPGFLLMLLASYLYSLAGVENKYFNASFRALQPIVAAMILRATHKIAEHSLISHTKKKVDPFLFIAAICTAINGALNINIFISLGLYGVLYTLITRRLFIPALILFLLQYISFALYVVYHGFPTPLSLALGIAPTPSLPHLFLLGLVAGSLSFGGAYTTIPFIQVEAVLKGGWLSANAFLDCIAIGNVLPAPIVIFATFVGFQGGLKEGGLGTAFAGAGVITVGMWTPCLIFTILGHHVLERLVRTKLLAAFFDGLCGSVVGVIAIITAQLLKSGIEGSPTPAETAGNVNAALLRIQHTGSAAVLYVLALAVLYRFESRYTPFLLLVCGAVGGQFVFI